jgi:phosphonate transport system ATP-binding protein
MDPFLLGVFDPPDSLPIARSTSVFPPSAPSGRGAKPAASKSEGRSGLRSPLNASPSESNSTESLCVALRGVTKRFGGATPLVALNNIDLDVQKGELCVLIGLSGSGKSTLLRHLNGLHTPSAGSVNVLGVDVDTVSRKQLRDLRRRVGFVFQNFNLVGRSTVLENVLTGALGRLRGPRFGVISYSKELRREAAMHLERVGLGDRLFQRTGTLSGGQQQRVGIARMLMQRPELVLADEPVASLDPEASRVIMELLFRICQEDGLTVICSLHQVELAIEHGTRLVGLRDGNIVLDTPTSSVDVATAMQVYGRLGGQVPADRQAELSSFEALVIA